MTLSQKKFHFFSNFFTFHTVKTAASLSFVLFLTACSNEKKPQLSSEEVAKKQQDELNQSRYLKDLPLDLLQVVEPYKATFVKNMFDDAEVTDSNASLSNNKRQLEIKFEEAVNTLYLTDKADKQAYEQVITLIKYSPTLFDSPKTQALLEKKSPVLADFAVHYRVQTALSQTDTQKEIEAASIAKDQVIAEQQSKITTLSGRVSSLNKQQEKLTEELESLKEQAEQIDSLKAELDNTKKEVATIQKQQKKQEKQRANDERAAKKADQMIESVLLDE